jgi:hypothetical protein
MNFALIISAIAMILCELLAFFGAATGSWDLAVLGLVFAGFCFLFLSLPTVWTRRP